MLVGCSWCIPFSLSLLSLSRVIWVGEDINVLHCETYVAKTSEGVSHLIQPDSSEAAISVGTMSLAVILPSDG